MSVLENRHSLAALCELGDGTLTGAGQYPGQSIRLSNVAVSGGNTEGYLDYPSTTPDQICKVIRTATGDLGAYNAVVYTGPSGYDQFTTVTTGFPPSPIAGSPFTADTRIGAGSGPYANLYARWTGETAWDLQTYPASETFTPQGIPSGSYFSYAFPGVSAVAAQGLSYVTGALANDPAFGGDSSYQALAEFKVFGSASEVCCWNEGATIEVNVDIWQIDFTGTYQPGTYGYHDFTIGTATYHSTLTQTVTIDSSWLTPYNVVHTFTIPQALGYFTFVNEFYVTAVTGP